MLDVGYKRDNSTVDRWVRTHREATAFFTHKNSRAQRHLEEHSAKTQTMQRDRSAATLVRLLRIASAHYVTHIYYLLTFERDDLLSSGVSL